jgi:hypothetical protein
MPSSMTKISSVTVGSGGAATIEFTGIPSTYTDLVVKASTRGDSTGAAFTSIRLLPNGSSSNGSTKWIRGSGATASSDVDTTGIYSGESDTASATASTFANIEWYISNYAGSTNKSISIDSAHENNSTTAYLHLVAGLWSITSAITSITLDLSAGSFVENSTATLYGVTKYSETGTGSKATGGTVTTSGGFTYHTFYSSGMFTPTTSVTCDFLVVAGGGAGGHDTGGGGGAGGLRSSVGSTGGGGSLESALSLTAQAYAIIVGAGGAPGGSSSYKGGNGTDSIFSSITSTGGGGGGTNSLASGAGANGGAGGGGSAYGAVPSGAAGTGTTNQGFAGGAGANANAGGGGGGAGVAGSTGSTGSGGNGVICSNFANATSTGISTYYAGGGGGGGTTSASGGKSGGFGGGGAGGSATTNTFGLPGVANTGGGGGGGRDDGGAAGRTGAAGGSGIVIIRYTT